MSRSQKRLVVAIRPRSDGNLASRISTLCMSQRSPIAPGSQEATMRGGEIENLGLLGELKELRGDWGVTVVSQDLGP